MLSVVMGKTGLGLGVLLMLSCGCSSSGSGEVATVARGGTGGVAGGAAGSGPVDLAMGGSAASATVGGGSGSGGAAPSGPVVNPAVAMPSRDCRLESSDNNCLSMAGTLGGVSIDQFCATASGVSSLVLGAWVFGCDNMKGYDLSGRLKTRRPGPFSEVIELHTATKAFELGIASTDGATKPSADTEDRHLVRAELAGTATRNADTDIEISGTFHALWMAPEPNCTSYDGGVCAAAEINGTFRTLERFGTCIDNTDCPGSTCEMAGHSCVKLQP